MRRATTIGLIGLVLLLSAARPASAQWRIIKWLEELSGPGPFTFPIGLSASFACQDKDGNLRDVGQLDNWLYCDQAKFINPTRSWKEVRNYWTVTWAKGSGANNLDYSNGQKRDDVSAWLLNVGPAYRASPLTDIGATIGVVHFSVPNEVSSSKLSLDGYLVLRPFGATESRWGQVFAIRLNTTYFPQGFTLADFGASGGAVLDGKAELISSVAFEFNFLHLLKKY